MGNAGGRLKKMRKSFRRISLSRSREKLDRSEQTRRSVSLMNLSVLKKNFFHRKKSRSSTTIAEPSEDEIISTEDKEILMWKKSSSSLDKLEKKSSLLNSQKLDEQEEKKVESVDIVSKSSDKTVGKDNSKSPEGESSHNNMLGTSLSLQNKPKEHKIRNEEFERTNKDSEIISADKECNEMNALNKIDETLSNIEQTIEDMNYEDLLIHLPSLKDEIHFLWIKSYDVKETNEDIYPKKVNTIEYTKRVLHKLYSKAFKQHDYCTLVR